MLHEHKAFIWLSPDKLHNLDWAEADEPVIKEYQNYYIRQGSRDIEEMLDDF